MNNKLLLVKSITLLFRESQLPNSTDNSAELARQIAGLVKLPEMNIGVGGHREMEEGLKKTVLLMAEESPDHEFDSGELLQQIKVITGDDTELYESLRQGIEPELAESTIKKNTLSIRKTLQAHLREAKVQEIISKASNKIKFQRDTFSDMRKFVGEVMAQLEPYILGDETRDPAVIGDVDLSNLEEVSAAYSLIQDEAVGTTLLKTGWQGINRMLDGGFRRGEFWVLGALQHNWKTGMSLSIFRHIALYNDPPPLKDPTKKPLLVRISMEDTNSMQLEAIFKSLKENETGLACDISQYSPMEVAEYVHAKMSARGWSVRFRHINPSMWTYKDLCNYIIQLENEGYEVVFCEVDYLLKLPTTGCDQGPAGTDLRNMYERVLNFMKARNILFLTPHQLSTDAKMLVRDGQLGLLDKIKNGGYYAGSKQIDQVVDGELYCHIEIVNGKSWLSVQRGKHRKVKQTPLEFRHCVLPFEPIGDVRDDLGRADSTRKKAGGGPIGSADETPFWEFKEAA
jgi:hypothetical protein